MPTKIAFNTAPYRRSHLAEPKGRGSWAFAIHGDPTVVFSPSMTYTEAKKWATEHFRAQFPAARHTVEVAVLP